jgi:arabinofuranosyltransferase
MRAHAGAALTVDSSSQSGGGSRSAAVAIAALIFVAWSSAFIVRTSFQGIDGSRYFCLFDDAMISMRYAWNLSHGAGLVWNPGERVEGYSNPLMTLVMAAVTAVADRRLSVLIVQGLGIITMLIAAWLAAAVADEVTPGERNHAVRTMAAAGTLAYYPLAYWSLMGMETGLVCVWLLAAVRAALRADRDPAHLHGVAAFGALGYLTRPDFAVPWLVLLAFAFGPALRHRAQRAPAARALVVAVMVPLLHLAIRVAYYGDPVPNTVRLKLTGMSLASRLENGIDFILPFLGSAAIVLVVGAIGLTLRFHRSRAILLAVTAVLIGYQIWVGGDAWNYWRIVAPAVPLLLILFAHEVVHRLAGPPRPVGRVGTGLALAVFVIGLWSLDRRFLDEMRFDQRPYQVEANKGNVNAAIALDRVLGPRATVGVFWAGTIPYYTGRPAVDFLGKSDPAIAARAPDESGAVAWYGMTSVPGHNKYDLEDSIRRRRPTYVQGLEWGRQDLRSLAESTYVAARYGHVELLLLRGSPDVHWDRLAMIPAAARPAAGDVSGPARSARGTGSRGVASDRR